MHAAVRTLESAGYLGNWRDAMKEAIEMCRARHEEHCEKSEAYKRAYAKRKAPLNAKRSIANETIAVPPELRTRPRNPPKRLRGGIEPPLSAVGIFGLQAEDVNSLQVEPTPGPHTTRRDGRGFS